MLLQQQAIEHSSRSGSNLALFESYASFTALWFFDGFRNFEFSENSDLRFTE
jgi:hypothetical protein